MSDRQQDLLHRSIDGELSAAEVEEWKRISEGTPELLADADDFMQLGQILREDVSAESESIDFADFMHGITAQLESSEMPQDANESGVRPGFVDSLKSWWSKNWTPVLVSAAAAAAVSFWIGLGAKDDGLVASDDAVLVDAVSNEGSKTVLISMPSSTEDSTIIWLLEDEEDELPTLGEDPI